jgi:hypothetical protein
VTELGLAYVAGIQSNVLMWQADAIHRHENPTELVTQ